MKHGVALSEGVKELKVHFKFNEIVNEDVQFVAGN